MAHTSKTQTEKNSFQTGGSEQFKLPRLNDTQDEKNYQSINSEPYDNPFYVPDDYEIFKMKEKEKETRRIERQKLANLHIYEKGLKSKGAFTIGSLNKLCEIPEENLDENQKLNVVDATKTAIKNRVRSKEPMHQFIEKKRDMLLFQMLIDHKREQINQFEEQTRLQKNALQNSEEMLEKDLEIFNQFLENNKSRSRSAIRKAEEETKKKQEKIQDIKKLMDDKAELTNKNTNKMEMLNELQKYKIFLDQVSKVQSKETDREDTEQAKTQSQEKKEETKKDIEDDVDIEEFQNRFTNPQQLEDIFVQLEEKILFIDQNTKDREEMVETLKQVQKEKLSQSEEKIAELIKVKNEYQNKIDNLNANIKKINYSNQYENDAQEQLKIIQEEISNIYKNDFKENVEIKKDKQVMDILKLIEKQLETQLMQIAQEKKHNNEMFQNATRECIKNRRQEISKLQKTEDNKQTTKVEKDVDRKKRYGRPIMKKSMLPKEEKEEKVVEEETEEEKERRIYFSDNYNPLI